MTVEYLKRGKPETDRAEEDAKVRAVVEAALKEIEVRGDAAVREFSEKFDRYSPPSFRLRPDEIAAQSTEKEAHSKAPLRRNCLTISFRDIL